MAILVVLTSLALILMVLHDGFEFLLLPRRVARGIRLTRLFYSGMWIVWRAAADGLKPGKRRHVFLSWFGPASVILLFSFWAVILIVAFGVVQWIILSPMNTPGDAVPGFWDYLYFSGVTFFTLGFGDLTPRAPSGRLLAVAEAGIGFAFLAVVISYLPVLYQAFSNREVTISLLDARAGSPPTASSLLLRLAPGRNFGALDCFFQDWERFAASVLESHLSFPILSYYRSQHDNQSWLAALTVILDASALTIAALKDVDPYQAKLTFAMSRHVVVDISQVFQVRPIEPEIDRLSHDRLASLLGELERAGLTLNDPQAIETRLTEIRHLYEPFVNGLSAYLILPLPPIRVEGHIVDNWQTSAWMKRSKGIGNLAPGDPTDDHSD
jgi:Ion channel